MPRRRRKKGRKTRATALPADRYSVDPSPRASGVVTVEQGHADRGTPERRARAEGHTVVQCVVDGHITEAAARDPESGGWELGTTHVEDRDGDLVRAVAVHTQDTLAVLLANGTITAGQESAGRRFQADFHRAALDTLKAVPLEPRIAGMRDDTVTLAARRRLARVVGLLGGHGAPAVNALWCVIGCGDSIRGWARRERFGHGRHLHVHTARRILVGALDALAQIGS